MADRDKPLVRFTAHHDHRPCSPGDVVTATSACGVGGMCPLGRHPPLPGRRQVLVDYRVASVARTGMRWTLGVGGSAVVAVVVVGVGGCWVSIARAALSQPAPRSRTQGGSCGCSPRGAAATVQIGHHRQSVPAAAALLGSDDPSCNQGSMRSSSASVSIRASVRSSSIG